MTKKKSKTPSIKEILQRMERIGDPETEEQKLERQKEDLRTFFLGSKEGRRVLREWKKRNTRKIREKGGLPVVVEMTPVGKQLGLKVSFPGKKSHLVELGTRKRRPDPRDLVEPDTSQRSRKKPSPPPRNPRTR